ncbi:hypothetical protein ACFE04_014404 [Oxalis oulophora]
MVVEIREECQSKKRRIQKESGLEVLDDQLSIKNYCLRLPEMQQVLQKTHGQISSISSEGATFCPESKTMQACKVCGNFDDTLHMLICDGCEEAFHVTCCKPKVKNLEIDEWFCRSCIKSKHKDVKKTTRKHVRVGKNHQVEVPDWCDQIPYDPANRIWEPLVMDVAETIGLPVRNSFSSSSRNLLQCRAVLDNHNGDVAKGIVCGKWRRAPFTEVQTGKWDCSCSVRWDQTRSDCAVPQELETDKVLVELNIMTRLRSNIVSRAGRRNIASEANVNRA